MDDDDDLPFIHVLSQYALSVIFESQKNGYRTHALAAGVAVGDAPPVLPFLFDKKSALNLIQVLSCCILTGRSRLELLHLLTICIIVKTTAVTKWKKCQVMMAVMVI